MNQREQPIHEPTRAQDPPGTFQDAADAAFDDWPALLLRAQEGDASAIGLVLERYRKYLRAIASRRMTGALRRRVDASDLVQDTLVEAHHGIEGLLGAEEPQRRAALRHILRCNVANAMRDHLHTAKRRATLEQPVEAAASHPGNIVTPSQQVSKKEQAARFLEAFSQLPADQAEALSMRYFEGSSVGEIAQALERSCAAAAGLLKRGLEQLRRTIPVESGTWP